MILIYECYGTRVSEWPGHIDLFDAPVLARFPPQLVIVPFLSSKMLTFTNLSFYFGISSDIVFEIHLKTGTMYFWRCYWRCSCGILDKYRSFASSTTSQIICSCVNIFSLRCPPHALCLPLPINRGRNFYQLDIVFSYLIFVIFFTPKLFYA